MKRASAMLGLCACLVATLPTPVAASLLLDPPRADRPQAPGGVSRPERAPTPASTLPSAPEPVAGGVVLRVPRLRLRVVVLRPFPADPARQPDREGALFLAAPTGRRTCKRSSGRKSVPAAG